MHSEGDGSPHFLPPSNEDARPAVTTADEVKHLKPEVVRWRRHWGWRRRHWRRRYWRRRYW